MINDSKKALRERKNAMRLENDSSFIGGDMTDLFEHDDSIYVFSDDQLVSAISPDLALITVASAQLRYNLYEPANYHIRLMGLNRTTTNLSVVADALATVHPYIGAYAFKGILNHLPYTINCPTKKVLNAVKETFKSYTGWSKTVDNDTYYHVFDEVFLPKDVFGSISNFPFRLNFSLRKAYSAHVRITKTPHIAVTACAVHQIIPSDYYQLCDLRRFFRRLPITLHFSSIDTAIKIAKAVTSCGGKAEVYEK